MQSIPIPMPEPLQALAAERLQACLPAGAELPASVAECLPRVLAWSGFVADVLRSQPDLIASGWLGQVEQVLSAADIAASVHAAVAECTDEAGLMRTLRRQRRAWSARIAFRDIADWAQPGETLEMTSALADACIQAALERLELWQRELNGQPRDHDGKPVNLIVIGMGKLGGGELNFSSDVDLVFAFSAAGESDGPRPLSNEQYFTRLGRKLIRVLDELTAEGFVYRVDMRLRPFGDSGPLVMSVNGIESYYEQHGREWERYAFVKARPVAGDLGAGEELLARLQPFVYRRYLDFGVFESLRDMKDVISQEVQRRELREHVKLGPGGIREAEFVVQLFQLIRGGREPRFRVRGFRAALHAAAALDCLSQQDADALEQAYVFLRRLENRLQEAADQQVHAVPEARAALACSLGFSSVDEFDQAWTQQRAIVRRLFDETFLGPTPGNVGRPLADAWRKGDRGEDELRIAGFADPETMLAQLRGLHERLERHAPGTQGLHRLNRLMPLLLAAAARQPQPDLALPRMLRLVEAVLGRSTYLALLFESPRALDQLARFCGASEWVAQLVARHPLLLDELLDPRLFEDAPTRASLADDLAAQLQRVNANGEDLETLMDALREFQQVSVLRVAAADISGNLPLMSVSDRLTDVAEIVIQAVLDSAETHLLERHGRPRYQVGDSKREARFLVLGYGKLGGMELGYGSDLDLVFLHDSQGEAQHTDGERVVDNPVFFLRLTQRLIHLLSTPTSAGVLYEVDTRLRPSGQAGLLVSSLEAFSKYQRNEAWTWEHQALLRARPVAGDPALAESFQALRRELLTRKRDVPTLRREVAEMRARMRSEGPRDTGLFDLKNGPGGITDIEFLAQFWVLRDAHAAPDLLEFTDTIRFLEGLDSAGLVPTRPVRGLIDAYRDLRAAAHAQALQGRPVIVESRTFEAARALVRDTWEAEFGSTAAASVHN